MKPYIDKPLVYVHGYIKVSQQMYEWICRSQAEQRELDRWALGLRPDHPWLSDDEVAAHGGAVYCGRPGGKLFDAKLNKRRGS